MDGDGGGALIEGRTEASKVGENNTFLKTNEVKKTNFLNTEGQAQV